MKISALLVSAVPDAIQTHSERTQSFFRCDILRWEGGNIQPHRREYSKLWFQNATTFFNRIQTSFSTHHLGIDEDCIMDQAVGPHLNCYRPGKLIMGGKEIGHEILRHLNAT